MILQVDGISFSYNSHPVLDGVSFDIDRGELLAVLGPNGVGKTTLLKCINAIQRPGSGSVLVDGEDVLALGCQGIARKMSYVAQRSEVTHMTAFDAVLMGRKPHIRWRVERRDLQIVDAAFKRLSMTNLAMRHVDCLSGGELQKIAIARALVQEPRLLLLDEPTSALDLRNQIEILTMIRHVVKEHQVAGVMTMHDLNTALRFADKALFLKGGRIHAACPSTQVTPEIIAAVYGLPVEIHTIGGFPTVVPAAASHKEQSCPAPSVMSA